MASLVEATAHIDHLGTPHTSLDVDTLHTPIEPEYVHLASNALDSNIFHTRHDWVFLLRVIENGCSLELRSLPFVELAAPSPLVNPCRLNFPAPLVPGAFIVENDSPQSLIVVALSESSILYRITLSINPDDSITFLHPPIIFSLSHITSSALGPLCIQAVDNNSLLISCADNSLWSATFNPAASNLSDAFLVNELRDKPMFSLGFGSRPSSLTLSLAITSPESALLPYAFTVTNDRKLCAWSLVSNTLDRAILFPLPTNDRLGNEEPLPPNPRRLVRYVPFQNDSCVGLVVAYIPGRDSFIIHKVIADSTGKLESLETYGEYLQPEQTIGHFLCDFQLSGDQIWTVWANGDQSETWLGDIPRPKGSEEREEEEEEEDTPATWTQVLSKTPTNATLESFDDILTRNSLSVTEAFVQHLFYPGRYAPSVLEEALEEYIETADLSEHTYLEEDLAANIIATISRSQSLDINMSTATPMYTLLQNSLKSEWLRFVAITDQYQRESLYPISLYLDPKSSFPILIRRNALTTLVRAEKECPINNLMKMGNRLRALLPAARVEDDISPLISSPLSFSINEVAFDLHQRYLAQYEEDADLINISQDINDDIAIYVTKVLGWLTRADDEVNLIPEEGAAASLLSNLWLVDYCQQRIEDRYNVATSLLLSVLLVSGDEDLVSTLQGWDGILSQTFATFHRMQILRWISKCGEFPPTDAGTRILESQFDKLGVMDSNRLPMMDYGQDSDNSTDPTICLLHYLLQNQRGLIIPLDLPSYDALAVTVQPVIKPRLRNTVEVTRNDIEFVYTLQERPSLVVQIVDMWPRDVALDFLKASAELSLGRPHEAKEAFDRAAVAFFDPSSISEEVSYLSPARNLFEYYAGIVGIVETSSGSQDLVAHFCRRAIEAYEDSDESADASSASDDRSTTPSTNASDRPRSTRTLWLKQFRALTFLARYHEAYDTLMSMPDLDMKTDSMRQLVTSMCETGNTALLLSFDFPGLQVELEDLLAFRCRNSAAQSEPDYYRISYSHFIKYGNFRAAAEIMYRHACRLGDMSLRADNFANIFMIQAQSLLSSINALSLVEPQHAWILSPIVKDSSRQNMRKSKDVTDILIRKWDNLPSDVEIVDLNDIRCDYSIVMGRLLLSTEMPELARSSVLHSPKDLVMLFAQGGKIDYAFSTAASQNIDMADLFRFVTTKCVRLSRAKNFSEPSDAAWIYQDEEAALWEGDTISKAWKMLHLHIQRHDRTGRNRMVVLEAILEEDASMSLPHWLVSYFSDNAPDVLIRKVLLHDRYADAFIHSINLLKKTQKSYNLNIATSMNNNTSAGSCLPWASFDDLLSLDLTDAPQSERTVLEPLQIELKQAIDKQITMLKRASELLINKK